MADTEFEDYIVKVDNPLKHFDPLETYISFRVTTKVKGDEAQSEEYIVRRRYSDFLWLRTKLIDSFPTLVVPALPAKHSVLEQLDRYSPPFILSRMTMLHAYLQRLTSHPVFSCCPQLKLFLTAKSTEFTKLSKVAPGIFDRLSDSFQNLTGNNSKGCSDNPEFKPIKTYINTLGQKLTAIQSVNCKIHKERTELQGELEDARKALGQWANLEGELSREIIGISSAIEAIIISQQKNLLNDFTTFLSQPLEEYVNYVDAVKEALNRRDAIQFAYENSLDESNRKRQEKEELETLDTNATGFSFKLWKLSNRDRIQRLQQDIPSLDKVVEENQDKVEIANESIKADLERWNKEKVSEMKGLLGKMADQHVNFYKDVLAAWESALASMKNNTDKNKNSSTPINVV